MQFCRQRADLLVVINLAVGQQNVMNAEIEDIDRFAVFVFGSVWLGNVAVPVLVADQMNDRPLNQDFVEVYFAVNQRNQLQIEINVIDGQQGRLGIWLGAVNLQAIDVGGKVRKTEVEIADFYLAAGRLAALLDHLFEDIVVESAAAQNQQAAY